MEAQYQQLEDLVRARYASVAWTHKIQEKQAEIYDSRYSIMATINIVAATITSVGIISLLFTDQSWVKFASSIVSFVSVFLGAFMKTFDFSSMSKANKVAATKLVALRDELQTLLFKIRACTHPINELEQEFENIQQKIHTIYDEAPKTSDAAVKMAGESIKVKKDNSFSDEEIDLLLPDSLKRGAHHE